MKNSSLSVSGLSSVKCSLFLSKNKSLENELRDKTPRGGDNIEDPCHHRNSLGWTPLTQRIGLQPAELGQTSGEHKLTFTNWASQINQSAPRNTSLQQRDVKDNPICPK